MSLKSELSIFRKNLERAINAFFSLHFPGSARYWDLRYRFGGTSGAGSYGDDMAYKSKFLNDFFEENRVLSVVDFGCGDGNQLRDLRIQNYLGFDVSPVAIDRCKALYSDDTSKEFRLVAQYGGEKANVAMSLDVIYHLVEDAIFDDYLARLFSAAESYVVIYASNDDYSPIHQARHVRHRTFAKTALSRFPQFSLISQPSRPQILGGAALGRASFFVFEKNIVARAGSQNSLG